MQVSILGAWLTEMARPAQLCTSCGLSMAKNHHWYKGGWRCKPDNVAKFQASGGTPTQAQTPVAAATSPVQAPLAPIQSVQAPQSPVAPVAPTAPPAVRTLTPKPAKAPAATKSIDQYRSKPPEVYHPNDYRIHLEHWLAKHHMIDDVTIEDDHSITVKQGHDLTILTAHQKRCPVVINDIGGDSSLTVSAGSLEDLHNFPSRVGGDLMVTHQELTTLEGCPSVVGGNVNLSHNPKLSSIEGICTEIGGNLHLEHTTIVDLRGIHKQLKKMGGYLDISSTPIVGGILGVMMIRGLTEVKCTSASSELGKAVEIINKHLKSDERDVYACQDELIDAGYGAFSRM